MPIAKDQVAEVFHIIADIVGNKATWEVLVELRKTTAFKRNSSFRKTIEALTAYHISTVSKRPAH